MSYTKSFIDSIAKANGYSNFSGAVAEIKTAIVNEKNSEMVKGAAFLQALTLKVLEQELIKPDLSNVYTKWVQKFYDGKINVGNTKEYIFHIQTGYDAYDASKFIPTKITSPAIESTTLSLLKTDGTLNDGSYRFLKPLTIQSALWTQYFISGKLDEFVNMVKSQIDGTFDKFIYKTIINTIKSLSLQAKNNITGSATKAFNAWNDELFPLIEKFKYETNKYNLSSTSEFATSTSNDDLVIMMSQKTYNTYNSGVLSQLPKAQLAQMENYFNKDNIWIAGYDYTLGDSDTKLVFKANEFIDDNTIYILDKRNLKHVGQLQISGQQEYALNLSLQLTSHKWGMVGALPQLKIVKYTNTALNNVGV